MTYPQQPPFPPEQGPQWQGGYPPPQYGPPAPPPPRRGNPVGVVLVAAGGVAILGLIIAIIVVLVRGGGSGGPEARQDPVPVTESSPAAETTPESTPEETPSEETPQDASGGSGVFPDSMDGSWSGTMTQHDPDGVEMGTWELEIHMTAGERVGTADLTLGDGTTCEWEILATGSTEDSVDLDYLTTDDGGGACTSSGFAHLIVSGDQLAVGVATEWPTGISTADGMLDR